MALRIAVCDDENNWINELEKCLLRYNENNNRIDWEVFYSGEELLKYFAAHGNVFDMLITDIEMSGINGVETANRIRELDKDISIIFLTNYEKYMRDCFSCMPSGFLDKPVSFDDIKKILDKKLSETKNAALFSFKYNRREYNIPFSEIIYVNNDMRKIILHTTNETYEFIGKLKDYEKIFEEHGFAMTHNSFCVNLSAIANRSAAEVVLKNGEIVPVSDSRRESFEGRYLAYIKNKR